MGIITIQTAGSFQSQTKTFRADHHGHAGGCRSPIPYDNGCDKADAALAATGCY